MRSLVFLLMAVGRANSMALAPADAEMNQLDTPTENNDHNDNDWAFATLDEAYDPDDPAIKDLPEMDTSGMIFSDYDTEMNTTSVEDHAGLERRRLVSPFQKQTNFVYSCGLIYRTDSPFLRHD